MATFTTVAAALKKHYYLNENTIPDLTFKKSPFLSQIAQQQWGGESAEYPIKLSHNQSHSATFTTAQGNAGNMNMLRWSVPTSGNKKHYTLAQIPGDVIAAMESRPDTYFPAVVSEVDSAFMTASRRLSIDLFRTGWGDVARVANSSFATTVMTCTNTWDAKNFEVGMKVVFSSSQNAAALRNAGSTLSVTNVDIDAGTVTFNANLSTVTGIAQNDWVFPQGDRQDSGSPSPLRLFGLEKYIPFDRTTVNTLFGVDRTQYPTRLAGRYLDGTGKRISESIIEMSTMLGDVGASPNLVVTSWKTWSNLEKELGSMVRYSTVGAKATQGFKTIQFSAGDGDLNILRDSSCPDNRIWVVNTDVWKLLYLGGKGPIRFLDEDEQKMLRQSTADSYEIRVGGYVELLCYSPSENGVIAI